MIKITTALLLIFVSFGFMACDTIERKTITVSVDRHPVLTIVNQTGHPVTITAPLSSTVAVGSQTSIQPTDTTQIDVTYTIEGIPFTEQVAMNNADATITLTRRPPTLTVLNQTGHPVTLTAPGPSNVAAEASHDFLTPSGQVDIAYFIGGFSFNQRVTVTDDMTVNLTERPPGVTIINNTGVFITLTSPISRNLGIGDSVFHLRQSPADNPLHTISYTAGRLQLHEQININNVDVTLSLTRRPPSITVVNNTGVTVTNVFIRNPGTAWGSGVAGINVLGIQLYDDGRLARLQPPPGSLVGSILNTERFTFWTGHLDGLTGGVFDIRLDAPGGVSFVMNNVAVTSDVTLPFTQAHRP